MRLFKILKELATRLSVDYITEQGTSNGWSYRKWNSGKVEMSFAGNVTGTPVGQVGGMYNYQKNFTLPFNVDILNASAVIAGRLGTGVGYCSYSSFTSQNNLLLYIAGNDNNSTMYVTIQVVASIVGGVVKTLINRAIGGVRYAFI